MNDQRWLRRAIAMALAAWVLVACTGPQPCSVECTVSPARALLIEITCESGKHSDQVFSYRGWEYYPRWDQEIYGTHFSGERTYEESGNTYQISALTWDLRVEDVSTLGYYVEVTGGVFGDTPLTCDVLEED